MGEGDPQEMKGPPPQSTKRRKRRSRKGLILNHKLEGTETDTAVRQGKVAHLPEGISRSVGTVLPQVEDMSLEFQEETPTHLQRGPVLGAEHRRYGQRSETSRLVPNLGKKVHIIILFTQE